MLALLFLVPFASAGFFDFLTGKATSATTDVTTTITSNTAPQITSVDFTSTLNPVEGTTTSHVFNFTAYDLDGASDINISSANIHITYSDCNGEARDRSASCTNTSAAEGQINTVDFTCDVTFQYYDCAGSWNVNATVYDLYSTPALAVNDSTSLTVSATQSITVSPSEVQFPSLSVGDVDKSSTINTTVNNTGNVGVDLSVNSSNLQGDLLTSYYFGAGNFSSITSNVTTLNNPCEANALVAREYVDVGNSTYGSKPAVNLDAGHPGQYVTIRYCIPSVPSLPRQNYTSGSEPWIVKGVFA